MMNARESTSSDRYLALVTARRRARLCAAAIWLTAEATSIRSSALERDGIADARHDADQCKNQHHFREGESASHTENGRYPLLRGGTIFVPAWPQHASRRRSLPRVLCGSRLA